MPASRFSRNIDSSSSPPLRGGEGGGIDGSREMRRSNQKMLKKIDQKTRVKEIQYTVDGDGNSGRENYKPQPSADASTMDERTPETP